MGSGVVDSVFGKSQAPIKQFLEKRGESFEQKSMIKELFAVSPSKNWSEKLTTLTAMNGFRPVGELGPYPTDTFQEGFNQVLEHMVWKDSFSVSRELIDDARTKDFKQRPENFIAAYYRTRERFAAALYGGAIAGAQQVEFEGKQFKTTGADGLTLFHKAHPSALKTVKKTQSNLFTDAFSNDALAALESKMQDVRGDNNEVLDVTPDTLLIPNDYVLKRDIFAAIGADKDPNTANNGFNFTFGRWNVIVWAYLNQFITADTRPWILLDSRYNETYGGAVWLDRVALEVKSDIDQNTDANVWRGYSRFIAGFNDWRFAAAAGVTGGDKLLAA